MPMGSTYHKRSKLSSDNKSNIDYQTNGIIGMHISWTRSFHAYDDTAVIIPISQQLFVNERKLF